MILEFARSQPYGVDRNPKGDVTSTTWLFLLDQLDGRARILGDVDAVTRSAIERIYGARLVEDDDVELLVVGTGVEEPPAAERFVYRRSSSQEADFVLSATRDGATPVSHPSARPIVALPPPTRARTRARRVADRLLRRAVTRGASTLVLAPARAVDTAAARPALQFAAGVDVVALPCYIRDAAAAAGVDLSAHRWRLMADADYFSQKALFLASPPGGAGEDLAIKVSRDPVFSARLHNEHTALSYLSAVDWDAGHRPGQGFSGMHAGLAIVGEEAVVGVPFVDAWDGTAGHPLLVAAADALVALSSATARSVSGADAAAAIAVLADQYETIGSPSERTRAAIRRDLDTVAAVPTLPVTAHHGDCGPWNLLVRPNRCVVFIDWENFEAAGPPGWDLAFLFEGAAATSVRRRRRRYTARSFLACFAQPDWRETMRQATRDLGSQLDTSPAAIDVLVRLAFMHLALKEATRLGEGQVGVHGAIAEAVFDSNLGIA